MERIDRKYAIIYVDRKGETLKEDEDRIKTDYTTKDMVSDYYTQSGFLQWNFYLIIPESLVSKKQKKEIENNDCYTRKYVIPDAAIESFIEDHFPILQKKHGSIKLIKGDSYVDSLSKAVTHVGTGVDVIGGWYRDFSLMYSLSLMDKLRAKLITDPSYRCIFYTHITNEFSIAEKKFKLFQRKKVESK